MTYTCSKEFIESSVDMYGYVEHARPYLSLHSYGPGEDVGHNETEFISLNEDNYLYRLRAQ